MNPIHAAEAPLKILTEERRLHIAQMLTERAAVNSEELAERFGVSLMTVYRDLKALEAKGRLKCVRGGAVRADAPPAEPQFTSKQSENGERKEAIARYAAQHFVAPSDVIILEAGTTVSRMVKYFVGLPLTLVTNGLPTLVEATALLATGQVMSCGGILRSPSHTFVGPEAERFFHKLHARTLFLGATGLSIPEGITDPSPLEIQVKAAMALSAERVVLLLDSSKFMQRSLETVLPLDRLHAVVTDARAPAAMLEYLRQYGIQTHIAPP